MKRLLLATLIAGFAFAASAQGVAVSASVEDAAAAETAAGDEMLPEGKLPDRLCLRQTGTRIVARRDPRTGQRCVAANGRVYSRDDLRGTGRVDIDDALRALDPSIH